MPEAFLDHLGVQVLRERPSLTRRRERYETASDLSLAIAVEQIVGWEIAQAVRLPDGSLQAVYVR